MITAAIVRGCLESSTPECRAHGDALINAVAAQIVASNLARATAQQQQAAAAQAAQSGASDAQIAALNQQLQQMQQQMAAQQAQSAQQIEAALAQQQAATQQALAQQAATAQAQLTAAQEQVAAPAVQAMADRGLDANLIARQQIVGQVMSQLDNVSAGLNTMRAVSRDVSDYARCNHNATDCEGPRRVAVFRRKAQGFFEPYDNVLDALERSLETAITAGIDVTDIFMMLTNSCQQWAKFLCRQPNDEPVIFCTPGWTLHEPGDYIIVNNVRVRITAFSDPGSQVITGPLQPGEPLVRCRRSQLANQNNPQWGYTVRHTNPDCTLTETLRNDQRAEIQQNWILQTSQDSTNVRMACIGDGLLQTGIFGRRNRQRASVMDIDALEDIINYDEPRAIPNSILTATGTPLPFCYLSESGTNELRSMIRTRRFSRIYVPPTTRSGNDAGLIPAQLGTCDPDQDHDCMINPMFALCTTHAYNIGARTNEQGQRDRMNEAIGLKSTVIAAGLRQQIEFLDSTVRQIRAMLQRSIMVANAEAAGAQGGGTGGRATGNNNQLDGARTCSAMSPAMMIECLRSNYRIIERDISNANMVSNQARAQMRDDAQRLASQLAAIDNNTMRTALRDACLGNPDNAQHPRNRQDAQNCLREIDAGIGAFERGQQPAGGNRMIMIPAG